MISPPYPCRHIRPALLQRGWLRWPFSWLLACVISLAMLALLASSPRPWQGPETGRLAVALNAQADQPAQRPAAEAARPSAPQAAKTPPSALAAEAPAVLATPAATPAAATNSDNAAPDPRPASPGSSSGPASAPPDSRTAASKTDFTSMSLSQRCPHQVKPVFPRRAQEEDIEIGRVIARLHLEADGSVRSVQILEANPRGYFEAETRRAALLWRCLPHEPTDESGRSVRVPFEFQLIDSSR